MTTTPKASPSVTHAGNNRLNEREHVISFNVSDGDSELIKAIVQRAGQIAKDRRLQNMATSLDISMSLTACHANGGALNLDALLRAPRFDFMHDVLEINRHIDKQTGKLPKWFVPRCGFKACSATV